MPISANVPFLNQPASRPKESSAWKWRLSIAIILLVIWLVSCFLDPASSNPLVAGFLELIGIWEGRGRVLIALVAFLFGLFYAATFVQRLYKVNGFRATLWSFLDNIFNLSELFGDLLPMGMSLGPLPYYVVVRGGKIDPEDLNCAPLKIGAPALLIVYEDSAVVLERDGRFSRVVGPGFASLGAFETVREVIDLRHQVHQGLVRGLTKDGIPTVVPLEIECQIRPGPLAAKQQNAAVPKTPYPIRHMDIRRAAYEKIVGNGLSWRWDQVVYLLARVHLRRLLRQNTLDKLIEPEGGQPEAPLAPEHSPRWQLQAELHRILQPRAHEFGATVLRVTLGRIQVEDTAGIREKIEQERIDMWKVEWEKRARVIQRQAEAEVSRLKEVTRAQAQAAMVTAITEGLPQHIDHDEAQRVIALRALESLEEMAVDPLARRFLPEEAIITLRQFHQVLEAGNL